MDRSRLSRQELIRLRRREGFVGRRGEIAAFRDNFARGVEDPAQQFLFHVHGQAGVGKTSLLRQFVETAREHGAPTAYVDEAAHDVPDAMAAVSRQLAAQGHPLKTFDKLLATYRERRYEVEAAAAADGPGDAADPGDLQGAAPSPSSMIAAQAGLAGLGLLPGVGAVTGALDPGQVARGAERLRGLLSGRLRNHDDVQLVMSPLQALTPLFVRELSAAADGVPWLALFFDTYERTGPLLDTWLRDVLVSDRYGPLAPNVVVTLAGQTALDRRCWADYLDCVTDLPLDAFTEAEARQFLATRDITDERIVEVILRLSGRLPVLVSTLAENRPQAAGAVDDPSDTAVERFLKWETDPVRREAALAAALPRHLDEDIFRAVVDASAAEQFGWLCGLPFVSDRAGRWQYHEVVRTAMLRLQRRRSPQTWAARHRSLAEAARRRWTELTAADPTNSLATNSLAANRHTANSLGTNSYPAGAHPAEMPPARLWTEEPWLEHRLQEIYHSLCAAPQPSLPGALTDVLDAADYAQLAARRVAETIRQAGEDAGAPEVSDWGERLSAALTEDGGGLTELLTALLARPGLDVAQQARIHRIRGREHRKAEAWPQAFADFDRCLELEPRNACALIGRGLTHRYLRSFERAAEDYCRALEITPDSLDAASQLGEAYRLLGRHEQAVAEFDRALELNPRHAFSIASRAVCLRRLARHDEALTGLERAIEINAEYAWAMAERGATYRDMGQYELALAEFDRALAVNPAYVWAHARRGITLRVMGRFDEALAALGRAAELQPDDPWVWGERCSTYLEMRRYDAALVEIERAIAVDPGYAWAHGARGGVLRLLGRHEEALAALDRSLALHPANGLIHEQRGMVLAMMGRTEDAHAELSAAIRLLPDSHSAVASRGKTSLLTGRLSEAVADFDRALELGADPGRTLALRGRTHLLRRDEPRALADFDRALRDGQADASLLALRSGCLRRAGHLDAAREAIEAAREAFDCLGQQGIQGADTAAAGRIVRYEAAMLAGALRGVHADAAEWEALRDEEARPGSEEARPGNDGDGPMGAVVIAVVSRCALGEWAGAEAIAAELLDGGPWAAIAETELGLRDLARLPGTDTEQLEAIRDGLIRRMAETATAADTPG